MWTKEDKETAERSAQALGELQGKKGPEVLQRVKQIRDQVANKRTDEHERAAAWLAVCALAASLEETPDGGNLPGLWHRAIQATNAWRGSMKN
ncbi:MAG: hypothetical protein R3D51_19490 [Hyphomicrobiaceae bacterium]